MNRDEFFRQARAAGWRPDRPLSKLIEGRVRDALQARFQNEDKDDLRNAPRRHDQNDNTMRSMTLADTLDSLIEELG